MRVAPTRRRISVEVVDSIFVLRGWYAHRVAIEAGLRPTFSGVHSGWMADLKRLPELEAYCQLRRIAVEIEDTNADGADRDARRGDDRADPEAITSHHRVDQLDLFGPGGGDAA